MAGESPQTAERDSAALQSGWVQGQSEERLVTAPSRSRLLPVTEPLKLWDVGKPAPRGPPPRPSQRAQRSLPDSAAGQVDAQRGLRPFWCQQFSLGLGAAEPGQAPKNNHPY